MIQSGDITFICNFPISPRPPRRLLRNCPRFMAANGKIGRGKAIRGITPNNNQVFSNPQMAWNHYGLFFFLYKSLNCFAPRVILVGGDRQIGGIGPRFKDYRLYNQSLVKFAGKFCILVPSETCEACR